VSWLRDGTPDADGHLGDALAGLVDGHLDHGTRERALAHLAHCADCRSDADDLRRLRSRLLDLGAQSAPVSRDLAARLLALEDAPAPARAGSLHSLPPLWVSGPVGASRPAGRPSVRTHPRPRPRVARAGAGGAAVVVGHGGVLAAGGPTSPTRPARTGTTTTVGVVQVDLPSSGPRRAELVSVRPAAVRTAR
jgi:hypothetical protein